MKVTWENAENGEIIGREKTKHTPAPWKVDGHGIMAKQNSRIETVATVYPTRYVDKANARLIAAAPDLLEACKAALVMFNDQMFIWGKDDDKKVCGMTKALYRAIQKAEAQS